MARFQTTFESISFLDGQRQPRALNARAVEPSPASPQAIAKGNVYVLVELGGRVAPPAAVYRLVLNAIQGAYYDAAGGITGGITEAIMAAHQALVDYNTVHPDEVLLGGVSCAVLRGEELYLGVGGPALALVGAPGQIDQFPAELDDTMIPLGGDHAPSLNLFRTSVDAATQVIQLTSEWVARVPMEELAVAATLTDTPLVADYLQSVAPERAVLSALVTLIRRAPVVEAPLPAAAPVSDEAEAAAADPEVTLPQEAYVLLPAAREREDAPAVEVEPAADYGPTWVDQPAETQAQPKPRRRWLWPALILIPLVLAVAVALGFWWQQKQMQAEFDTWMQGAQAALQSASAAGVPAQTAQQQLADAKERVSNALKQFPDNVEAVALEQTIQVKLDEVNKITPLYKLLTLQPLGGADSQPDHLVIEGSRVYVGDTGKDRVLRYGLDEVSGLAPETSGGVVVERGQTLSDGQVVGELVDMAWAEAGGERRNSGLLILDSNRNLLELDNATGVRPLAFANREQLSAPRVMKGYNGNLYMLDSGLGKILRYRPSTDGYSNAPEPYLENDATLDLSRAVDMAIDGNIWVLYSDGTVQTFFEGRQQPFVLEPPPDTPIAGAQALFTGAEAGDAEGLYIVDAANGRILQYDKAGKYVRQFRSVDKIDQEKLRKLRDLEVDEINRTFFILASDGLYKTDIPE